jgi:hypothetical protein
MVKRPTQKQLEQIKARCDRIQEFKIETMPFELERRSIGKLTAKPIGKLTSGKKRTASD